MGLSHDEVKLRLKRWLFVGCGIPSGDASGRRKHMAPEIKPRQLVDGLSMEELDSLSADLGTLDEAIDRLS